MLIILVIVPLRLIARDHQLITISVGWIGTQIYTPTEVVSDICICMYCDGQVLAPLIVGHLLQLVLIFDFS